MLKSTEEYLREQSDLISFLAKIPAVQEAVRKNQEAEIISKIVSKIPNELFEGLYSVDKEKPLKDWIKDNCNSFETHLLHKHFKI